MKRNASGFTLIELLVTVVIVSILALGAAPVLQLTVQREKEKELSRSLREIREAIDAYKRASDEGRIKKTVTQSGYPTSLELLAEGVPDEKDPKKKKIRFLRRIPRDPMNTDAAAAPDTWGKRSYESDPDAPKEGDDVYDVYSLSARKGLNGQPYSAW